jgi:hypothetical protein
MWHVWGSGEVLIGYWWGNLRDKDYLIDLGIDGRILNWMFNRLEGHRPDSYCSEQVPQMQEIFSLAENQLASQEVLCSLELDRLLVRINHLTVITPTCI